MLAVVFFYGGGAKLLDPQAFAVLIDSYGIVPDLLVMPAAIGLPLLEVIAAVGLVADIRGSLTAIGALLLVFMAILGYAGSGWGWMWTAGVSAPKIPNPGPITGCGRLYIGIT